MKNLFLGALLAISVQAQLDYSPKPANKDRTAKMHFALALYEGNWNADQREFLIRAIRDRHSITEQEAVRLFDMGDARDIFGGIGRTHLGTFPAIFNEPNLSTKKQLWRVSDRERMWRINFAWVTSRYDLTDEQIDYLVRFSRGFPSEAEAKELFPKQLGQLLFATIGPYMSKPCVPIFQPVRYTWPSEFGDCPCNIGSSFNMQCSDTCAEPNGACTLQDSGCGFAWRYKCNGNCKTGELLD